MQAEIDKEYDASKIYFMVDMAHIAGLVAAGLHQSPLLYADVVTSTTHKTLRGPRGGLILWNDEGLTKKINSAVFPGVQGGPLENIIAAKAVCFGEALKPEFREYQQQVIKNAQALAKTLSLRKIKVLTDGTDNHTILIDLRENNLTGQELQDMLEEVKITANKNAIPFDTKNKMETSGLRLGTPAITSRGLKEEDIMTIGNVIADCILFKDAFDPYIREVSISKIEKICKKYPLYK